MQRSRREFLTEVGCGAVAASVGAGLAADLGFATAFADEGAERLTFGRLEPLVAMIQETPPARLIPQIVERLNQGAPLRDVVAAAAYANARTFGGEDYVGFHTMMAIPAAYHMAGELPESRQALPVLKVLFRNANRITERGGSRNEVLHPVRAGSLPAGRPLADAVRDACRQRNVNAAEQAFAALSNAPEDALNAALYEVQDGADVHRVVLPYRAWDLMGIIGREQAHTLLRQSIRFCVKQETPSYLQHVSSVRTLVPSLLDQHRLVGRELGIRMVDDGWVEQLSETFYRSTPEQAAEAAAGALAEGISPEAVGEAICLAANQLVLRDHGRTQADGPQKPIGSVHGDSTGVHGCDSANAWRNLARAANPRNRAVCLILGAWQVARDRRAGGARMLDAEPYPRAEHQAGVRELGPDVLLRNLDEAIRANDQARSAALAHRYGQLNLPARPVWDLLLRYAISDDGALHAEKFYRTAVEEYAAARPAFKWRQVIALARVTASAHGFTAPGHADACRLLGV